MDLRRPEPGYSWLCRDRIERDRFLEIDGRMMRTNMWLMVLLPIMVVPIVIAAKPIAIGIIAATLTFFLLIKATYQRFAQPEVVVAIALLAVEVGFAAAIIVDGIVATGALVIILWPAAGLNTRYPPRVAAATTAFAALLIIGSELGFGGSAVLHQPAQLTTLVAALIAMTAITNGARGTDIEHRREATHDPLTRTFNRTALEHRVAEIEQQSKLATESVAVLVGDIDHFKAVNDQHGHSTGDIVLREVADIIRNHLRAFDPVYRLGGEEFVVLLYGRDAPNGTSLAEALRIAICKQPIAEIPITISFGVAWSEPGKPFRWHETFQAADNALYEAKRRGRNRVETASRIRLAEGRDGRTGARPLVEQPSSEAEVPTVAVEPPTIAAERSV